MVGYILLRENRRVCRALTSSRQQLCVYAATSRNHFGSPSKRRSKNCKYLHHALSVIYLEVLAEAQLLPNGDCSQQLNFSFIQLSWNYQPPADPACRQID